MPRNRKTLAYVNTWLEILIRIAMAIAFFLLEKGSPFKRKIHTDEIWLYRNPRTDSFVPTSILWPFVFGIPCSIFLIHFLATKNKVEFLQANLSLSLALGLNGIITNVLKLCVGRPRPDFFWRCFPNGEINVDMECTGDEAVVAEGRKSFPSGHSSFSFVSMCFIALYLMGKLHVFGERGRGQSWRLLISMLPLFFAMLVAVSRTCDYHHHWQDVTIGSLIGIVIAYLCYRQYFPALDSKMSHRSYADIKVRDINEFTNQMTSALPETDRFLDEGKDTKWI
ncbi:phospholipid phosphatase 5 [Contarinia nasturtii]|uniref:phospholipid phosphatase 5 n=1 Tax=Contarinia nasturtii TaxID=265458 RepID=UPI0012D4453D|nr:phospholipid phosphatase 5 [Contarinia nasturtii]